MINFGTVRPGSTLYVPFDSFAGSTGASITLTGLAVTDIEIYKNGSTTQRASDTGYTLLDTDGIDFDAITGIHGFSIDLSSNADAGFFVAGADYFVVVSSVTIDSQTVSFIAARFQIGYEGSILDTTIATLSTQISFTLTSGPAEDDAISGMWAIVHDAASAIQLAWVIVADYVGSTKTVTLAAAPTFTIAAGDNISIMFPQPLQPLTPGRTLQVESDGMAHADVKEALGIAWNNGAVVAGTVAAGAANKIADHCRRRTQANVEASSDGDSLSLGSEYGMIQQMQESNLTAAPGSQTVYKTDGTTSLGTKTVTSDASAEPITGIS